MHFGKARRQRVLAEAHRRRAVTVAATAIRAFSQIVVESAVALEIAPPEPLGFLPHAILQESPRKRAARTRAETPALLKGLLYGPDGAAFSPTHTRKGDKLYRYYVSQTVLKHGAGSCPVGRVPAGEIEAAVIDRLCAVFRQPEIVAGTWKAAKAQDGGITEADARAALQQLDPLWDELFPAEQARIVALLDERIDIGADGLDIRLRVDGLRGLAREILAGDTGLAA